MFNCINHGWTSFEKPCSICNPINIFSSNSTTGVIIGVNTSSWSYLHEQIEFLKSENARYREALEFYADESNWSESDTKDPYQSYLAMTDCGDKAREALKGGE
jgi:hypothetical protein